MSAQSYQENDRHVEQERDQGVHDEGRNSEVVDIAHRKTRQLNEEGDNAVGHGASGSKVVERHQRVHLEFGGAEEALHHDQTEGFENDTTDLDYSALGFLVRGILLN